MQLKKLIILFIVIYSIKLTSQNPNDIAFVLSERAVNKVFAAVGEIEGKNEEDLSSVL